ncbi:MAG: hypothetical protein HC911_16155, partial [Chloroflexaceae bacterium]|nr:hypothetical protein [Chloroflexaceae bacterium]
MTEQNRTGAMVAEAPDELVQEPNAQVQHADHDGTTNGAETSPVAVVAGQSAAHEPAAAVHSADGQPAPADEPITGAAAASASAIVDATSAPETAQDAQDGAVGHTLTFHAETEAEASQPAEQASDSTAVADVTEQATETVADVTEQATETVADVTEAVAETVADATEQASGGVPMRPSVLRA